MEEFNFKMADIKVAISRLQVCNDFEFVALTRAYETKNPDWNDWVLWINSIRRELDMRLLLKGRP